MGLLKRLIKSKAGSKNAYWYIRYTVNGKERWESVGKAGEVTKAVAQARLEERKRQVRLGQLDMIGANIPTLVEFSGDYIRHVRDVVQKRSWTRDIYGVRYFLKVFGNKKLSEITPKDIDGYKKSRLAEAKPATVNRELQILRHLFNLAYRWKKFFGRNPVSESGLLEVQNKVERIVTPEEEERLLSCSPPHMRPILITAINTGMRKGEILSLTWNDVDLENKLITIRPDVSKSKKTRRIPLNSTLIKLLMELKSGSTPHVFLNSEGNPYKRCDSIKGAFERACKKAELKGLRFHDLRHTFATRALEAGANVVAVSQILGHADLKTTMRYVHPDDSLKDAVARVENFISHRSNFRSNESPKCDEPNVIH